MSTDPEQLFRLVCAASMADDEVQAEEKGVLLRAAARLDLSRDDAQRILREVRADGRIRMVAPEAPEARQALLQDMIDLVVADAEVTDRERRLVAQVGAAFGYHAEQVEQALSASLARVVERRRAEADPRAAE